MVHIKAIVLNHPKFPGLCNALVWDVDELLTGKNPIVLFNSDRTYYAQLNKFRGGIYRSKKCVGKNKGPRILGDKDAHAKTLKKSLDIQIDFSCILEIKGK